MYYKRLNKQQEAEVALRQRQSDVGQGMNPSGADGGYSPGAPSYKSPRVVSQQGAADASSLPSYPGGSNVEGAAGKGRRPGRKVIDAPWLDQIDPLVLRKQQQQQLQLDMGDGGGADAGMTSFS